VVNSAQAPTGQQANVIITSFTPSPSIRVDAALTIPAGGSVRLAPLPQESTTVTLEYLPLSKASPGTPAAKSALLTISDALVPGALLTLGLTANDSESRIVDAVGVKVLSNPDPASNATKTLFAVTLRDTLDGAVSRSDPTNPVGVDIREFTLTVAAGILAPRVYANLGVDLVHPRYAPTIVTGRDPAINLAQVDPPPPGQPDVLLPAPGVTVTLGPNVATIPGISDPGADEDLLALPTETGWLTDALNSLVTPIDTNSTVPIVNIVAIPDIAALSSTTDALAVQQAVLAHCELLGDRFGVLDSFASNQDPFTDLTSLSPPLPSIETQRQGLVSARGYTALYYPWIRVLPATRGPLVSVPPSGHICGLFARVDYKRGVHKAPANEPILGAVSITRDMTNTDQGILNLQGINVIRTFTAGGQPILFGARTTTTDTNWQYVSVRRLFLFLETSIANNLRTQVFEPNNTALWGGLKRTISAFLLEQWHNGAIFGDKPDQAFYVKIDETNNPFTDRQLGKLTIELGVQPTYPAEFIIVRIGIWDGGTSVSES
jgi:Bacteriophage tail sheath protein